MMDQNIRPLYEKIFSHRKKNPISFHVPGHKNGLLYQKEDRIFSRFLEFDLTELTGLDDLHDPQEMIQEAEHLLSNLYRSKKSFFLVNGSTTGNLAMLLAVCEEGDEVLVQRNCHKSIIHACMLAKVRPIFISPEMDDKCLVPGGPSFDLFKRAVERYPHVKACIFTYPNYYGQVYDLNRMIDLAHQLDIPILIDEAHGPHFSYGPPFPPSALSLGADMVVHSAHKMLPSMTMGSYLHINSDRISLKRVRFFLNVLQSSSPSYPIMASLDFARHYLATYDQFDVEFLLQQRKKFISHLSEINQISVIETSDPLKLIIRHNHLSGYDFQQVLENMGIFPELADPYQVLFILPLLKKGTNFPFDSVLEKLQTCESFEKKESMIQLDISLKQAQQLSSLAYSYQEMQTLKEKYIHIDRAVDCIAARSVIPYPPGIPLLMAGERISNQHIDQIRQILKTGARFQGDDGSLKLGKLLIFDDR